MNNNKVYVYDQLGKNYSTTINGITSEHEYRLVFCVA